MDAVASAARAIKCGEVGSRDCRRRGKHVSRAVRVGKADAAFSRSTET